MAVVVSHAMRRYPTSPSGSYTSHCLKGEGSYQNSWSSKEVSESSLARSMKYAEPWLYGSMRSNGGLLLAPALVICSCAEYLNGTKRSSKKSPILCKKCRGTRLPLPSNDTLRNGTKFGTVRCYPTTNSVTSSSATSIRPETVRVSSHSRPSILPSADPYELMRRSRLSTDNGTQFKIRVNSPREETKTIVKKSTSAVQQSTANNRKSILECDINPYDLMSVESQSKANGNVTLVAGQRIRTKSNADIYEDVKIEVPRQPSQIPKLNTAIKNKPKELPKEQPKFIEKESDCNRFKSILKKPTTFGDTDSTDCPERSPSPAQKSGSHFYLPMPMNTPRKKVQFLVENESVCLGQVQNQDHIKINKSADLNNERLQDKNIDSKKEEEECFEDIPENNFFSLRRIGSERLLQDTPKVVFYDTMALRARFQRNDARKVFNSVTDLQRLDGVALRSRSNISEDKHFEKITEKSNSNLELHTNILNSNLQMIDCNDQISNTTNCNSSPYIIQNEMENIDDEVERDVISEYEEIPIDTNPIEEQINDIGDSHLIIYENKPPEIETLMRKPKPPPLIPYFNPELLNGEPPAVPPRKRSNNKQPGVAISYEPTKVDFTDTKMDTSFSTLEKPNKTVVQIRLSPTVHKIQIKNEFLEPDNIQTVVVPDNAQRKTSIMINGDDCYSTINVNDDIPLYQSSVVVKDTDGDKSIKYNKSSTVYITGNFLTTTSFPPSNQISVTSTSNGSNSESLTRSRNETSATPNNLSKLFTHSYNTLERRKIVKPDNKLFNQKPVEKLELILKDPVEAVKRNLVPHVCGKSDMYRRHLEKTPEIISPCEDRIDTNISKLVENTPISIDNENVFSDEDRDEYSEHSSSTQYEMMDLGSDCYTDNSNRSSVTEEELSARTKFYELLADSAIAELSENDDHHYECIRLNNDPIYEEIAPPPLPSNPPPSCIIDDLQLDKQFTTRSIFEGASKYDILSYLVDAKERGLVPEDTYNFGNSDVIIEEEVKEVPDSYRVSNISSDSSEESSLVFTNSLSDDLKNSQKSAEVERNDSGVGSETSKSSLLRFRNKSELSFTCEDCETTIEPISENDPLLCRKCMKKRSERKEIITEIVETEEKYSRDLQIILEEFYQPMLVAGLLTPDQLSAIFLNAEELLENSQTLAERLRDAVEIAIEQGDEDLLTVNIGKLFLEAAPMLHGFETYCVRQGNASLLLASLEKEKELLRIFLRVSQMENTMLRRMNLNSFLMVPVQRVTKYPLLLTRLYKSTPTHHENREQIKEAQHKVELHLNHMNSETKDIPSKLWRRIGSSSGRRASTEMDLASIKLRKIAVDVLEWNHDEAKFVFEGKLLFTQPTDNNWRKGRTIKLAPINALLVMNGKQTNGTRLEDNGLTFAKNGAREAAILLIRDKNGRYSLLREPLYLDRCIIATDPSWQSYFEVQEVIGKDTFIFKAESDDLTRKWYRLLQYHAQGLGGWRKRRNALANIMINGMGLRS